MHSIHHQLALHNDFRRKEESCGIELKQHRPSSQSESDGRF
jgi:hypothetical protein